MFTIKRFKIHHNNRLIYDCVLEDGEIDSRSSLLTTLIIGENGVGKSYLLRMLSDFFRFATFKGAGKGFKYENVELVYVLDRDEYKVLKNKDSFKYLKNGEEIKLDALSKPKKVLALSFMVNDKFSFSNNQDDLYEYLGVRATSNATYTSSIQKKLLSSLLSSLSDASRVEALKTAFQFLNIGSEINIRYKLRRKTLFSRGITHETISRKISSLSNRKEYFSNSKNEEMLERSNNIISFVNEVKRFYVKEMSSVVITLDLSNNSNVLSDRFHYLEMLERLEFLAPPEVDFIKDDKFSFEHTSSGEKHFLYTMINLISHIENNSLILIDEPELSLHPRWQMRYIRLLKEITKKHYSSHCILASHSHFMVSDLDPKSSTLLSLKKCGTGDYDSRVCNLIEYDTYAWSAENILYRVFGLRTARNFYFEKDISDLLSMISSKSRNLDDIRRLYEKLLDYSLDANDPINILLSECREYLESVEND
ncbi:AAA family ATPase [Halomonas sp. 5021]|uniref:AAA family ATPase n=1 Tax=Halomonas sp. 5021 TaxID=3082156 RepID=UPI002FCB0338